MIDIVAAESIEHDHSKSLNHHAMKTRFQVEVTEVPQQSWRDQEPTALTEWLSSAATKAPNQEQILFVAQKRLVLIRES